MWPTGITGINVQVPQNIAVNELYKNETVQAKRDNSYYQYLSNTNKTVLHGTAAFITFKDIHMANMAW